jgi:ribonuclease P protein component
VLRAFFLPHGKGSPRLAVVVSKKVSKKAVTRNRIRRRLIEAVKKTDWYDDQKPMQIVLLGLRDAENVEFLVLVEEMKKSIEAIHKRYR